MIMRKILGIAMPLLIILCIVTGIAESRPSHTGTPVAHIFIASLFLISIFIHVWLNRKALTRYYFKGGK